MSLHRHHSEAITTWPIRATCHDQAEAMTPDTTLTALDTAAGACHATVAEILAVTTPPL